jgi:hypothetical protein
MLARRQILTASAALPAILAALAISGCESLDVAEGKRPAVSREVRTLEDAITTEQGLIDKYNATMATYSGLSATLTPLLAEHREHLSRLQATISYPAGYKSSASASASPRATAGASQAAAVSSLRSAESAAAASQLARLAAVSPAHAQLLASIATCESVHSEVLS